MTGKTKNKIRQTFCTAALLVFLLLPGCFFQGCAKVGSPTGGIKDTNPPVYVEGKPENRSTNFKGKEIEITFDEYLQLKDQSSQMVISPPLKSKPVTSLVQKTIKIEFKDEFYPETTYTINFGNAISDNNEGNLLPDFEFVFSTGGSIDSLSVIGKSLNAFDHKPPSDKESVYVMLYDNLSDSAPLVEAPKYIGKVNKNGLFSINNVRPDTFRIFALKDLNSNLKYDSEEESIAFTDSLLFLNATTVKPVSFIKDTVKIIHPVPGSGRQSKQEATPVKADTVIVAGKILNALNMELFYFTEESRRVYLTDKRRDTREKLSFVFSRPPHEEVKILPVNFNPQAEWHIRETSIRGDSLTLWITDTLISKMDTLKLSLKYTTLDSANMISELSDTVLLTYVKPQEKDLTGRRNRPAPETKSQEYIGLVSSITNKNDFDLNKRIVFSGERPVRMLNEDKMELYKIKDSISIKQAFTSDVDSVYITKFIISYPFEESTEYRLFLQPGAVEDIYGLKNDTVDLKFKTQKADYYGKILVTLQAVHYPLILQVFDQKDRLIQSRPVEKPGQVEFSYLKPEKYLLKAIYDTNGNKKWDTGNYIKHIQPEPVFINNDPIELRSNWDYEVTWNLMD